MKGFMKPKSIEKSCYKYKVIWSSKNVILPEMVSISSHKKFIFNCLNCNHEYEQSPDSKTSGAGCPYCINKSRCGDCERCLKNSCFIYKDEWSDKNKEKCEYVAISSNKKYIFNCDDCNHEYHQRPLDKSSSQGCPYCVNIKRCGNCEHCLKNSCFIYKDEWSDKNKEKCEDVAIGNDKKFIFDCLKCSHEYEQSPNNKSSQGSGCPYCVNQKRCGSCEQCLKNSCFIYKIIWSDKNKENCEYVAISSGKKYWFDCKNCKHKYKQSPCCKTTGKGCPYCVNKTELKVSNFLKQQNIKFISQFKIKKFYDFYLPDFNLILEIDGDQHFRQVSNWDCYKQTMKNDIEKMKTGLENSISFLRIYQPDIWEDTIDWKTIIIKNLHIRTLPDITYVSSNNCIYDNHKNLLNFL